MNNIKILYGTCFLGGFQLQLTDKGVCGLSFGISVEEQKHINLLDPTLNEIVQHIEQPSVNKISLPLDPQGTPFQLQVWAAIRQIPLGQVASYSYLAQCIGKPTAVRAVASACASNKIAILIPCHRVVRKNGQLGEYRWCEFRKKDLLEREGLILENRNDEYFPEYFIQKDKFLV